MNINIECKVCKKIKEFIDFPETKVSPENRKRKTRITNRTCKNCVRLLFNEKRRNKTAKRIAEILLKEFGTTDSEKIKDLRRIRRNDKARKDYHTKYKSAQKRRVRNWINRNKDKHKLYCQKSNKKAYNKLIERLNQTYGHS